MGNFSRHLQSENYSEHLWPHSKRITKEEQYGTTGGFAQQEHIYFGIHLCKSLSAGRNTRLLQRSQFLISSLEYAYLFSLSIKLQKTKFRKKLESRENAWWQWEGWRWQEASAALGCDHGAAVRAQRRRCAQRGGCQSTLEREQNTA